MASLSLLEAYDQGKLTDAEVLANLPERFAEKHGRCLSVRGILSLIDRFPGNELYVPCKPAVDHALAALLSKDDLTALVDMYGGARVSIPAAATLKRRLRRKLICELRDAGKTVYQVARQLGVCERWVQMESAACREHRAVQGAAQS